MRILRNYLLKEVGGYFILSLGILTSIMLLGNLVRLAEMVITKGVALGQVARLFLYLIPYLLSYTLPVACLASVLLALGRMASDNEISAIRTSGVNLIRLASPIIFSGLILSLVGVILNDQIIPRSHYVSRKILKTIGIKNPTFCLEEGRFITSFENYILFVYHIKGNKMKNVRIYEPQGEERPPRTIVAKKGEFVPLEDEEKLKLKLIDGTIDEPNPKDPYTYYKMNFKNYFMTLHLAENQEGTEVAKKPKDMTLGELKNEINKIKALNIEAYPLFVEFHKKIALSFASLVFVLIAFPLAIVIHRREKSIGFGLTFLIALSYYLLFLAAESLSLQAVLPAFSIWAPNILFTALGIILLLRLCVS